MQRNRIHYIQKQNPSMSASHTHTPSVGVTQSSSLPEDDENDICPICESECTCDNNKQKVLSAHTSLHHSGSSAQGSSSRPPAPLKIKLTVPPNLLSKSRGAIIKSTRPPPPKGASYLGPVTGEFSLSDPRLQNHLLDPSVPKRRGRPPKVVVAAREAAKATLTAAAAHSSPGGSQPVAGPSNHAIIPPRSRVRTKSTLLKKKLKLPSKSKVRGMIGNRGPAPRKRATNDDSYHPRGFSRRGYQTDDEDDDINDFEEDEEDPGSLNFPTFVSATDSSSSSKSSSSSSSSDSDMGISDDSDDEELRMEEESYILDSEQEKDRRNRKHDKARLKRELFGDADPKTKGRSHHSSNRWEIKPRRRSVSGSDADGDADMDVDSDENSTEADEDEPEGKSAEDEPESKSAEDDPQVNEVNLDGRRKCGVSFAGVVTGWSEGEESSYDADVFFAHLDEESDSDSDSTMTLGQSSMDADCEDGELDGDLESADDLEEAMSLVSAAGLDGLSFDIARGWDGQFVFTSGLDDHDMDVMVDTSPYASTDRRRQEPLSDIDLFTSALLASDEEGQATHQDAETDEDYEEYDGIDLAESDGETTEDELVGDDGLPNARAMMLFRCPVSVSSVNPMNTLSPGSNSSHGAFQSTSPVASTEMESFDEHDRGDSSSDKSFDGTTTPSRSGVASSSTSRKAPRVPTFGHFEITTEPEDTPSRAIITGQQTSLPSPYPRRRRSNKPSTELSKGMRRLLRDRSLSISGQSIVLGDETTSTPSQAGSLEMFSGQSMDLDDVLDATFLASEPSTSDVERPMVPTEAHDERRARSASDAARHLERWDRIPMATFRRTRESRESISIDDAGAWGSPITNREEFFAGAIRNTPIHPIIPQTPKQQDREDAVRNILGSPVALNAGDRTPSNIRNIRNFHSLTQDDEKTEREKKDEKKLKRKMAHKTSKGKGKAHSPQHQQSRQRHQHHPHHPNSKSRASGSSQRNNFFSSASIPSTNT